MGTAVCQKRTTDLRLLLVVLRGERDSDASEPGVMHEKELLLGGCLWALLCVKNILLAFRLLRGWGAYGH